MPLPANFPRPAALLFDLDGTLLDSFQHHFRAYMALFARYNIHVTEESFFAVYSPNWLETYQRVGLPRELWEEADRAWMEEALKEHAGLFPGVPELLERLRGRYRLGLVTSGSKQRVQDDLQRNGIRDFFEVIITGGNVQRPKPDPQGLELALAALGLPAAQAVYIGDAQADYEMAQAGGVRFIGVPSRFASLQPKTDCARLDAITGLLDLLEGTPPGLP